jgi:UDP-glucose 4-epimerase
MGRKKKTRVLLVGGNGFIGSHLVDELLREEYGVRVLDRKAEMFRQPVTGVEYVIGSFADVFTLREAIDGCEILIHLAHSTVPLTSLNHPEEEVLDSVGAFVNMINCFKNKGIQKIIFFSSGGAVYGNPESLPVVEDATMKPISPYGVAKIMMEKYLYMFSHLYGLEYIIVRPSNAFGPRQDYKGAQGVIPIFVSKILDDETIQIWGDGKAMKDYIYVGDVVKAVVGLMKIGFDKSVYNVSSGVGRRLLNIIEDIGIICGRKPKVEHIPAPLYDVKNIVLSSEKIIRRTGWKPTTSFEDGLLKTLRWVDQAKKSR